IAVARIDDAIALDEEIAALHIDAVSQATAAEQAGIRHLVVAQYELPVIDAARVPLAGDDAVEAGVGDAIAEDLHAARRALGAKLDAAAADVGDRAVFDAEVLDVFDENAIAGNAADGHVAHHGAVPAGTIEPQRPIE